MADAPAVDNDCAQTDANYPAAGAVAARAHQHFAAHAGGTGFASVPDSATIKSIANVAFWASLRREEGYSPQISMAYVAPHQVPRPMLFERQMPMAAAALTRLAPAVERPGIHLGVWPDAGMLRVWGATRNLPASCFVIEVIAPGLLVIKQSPGSEPGKFLNIAVLQGDQVKVIDQGAASMPDCPGEVRHMLKLDGHPQPAGSANVLIQLAVSMRAHRRGGMLLVVPAGSDAWRESIVQPVSYSLIPPFDSLTQLLQGDSDEHLDRHWQDSLVRAVDGIAGLTAVDGATIITSDFQVLAFGAKIARRSKREQVPFVIVTEPVEGDLKTVMEPAVLGGTRHLSAAQFAHDQRDSVALVASQDGHFTVFGWSVCEGMVHAHRIDSLLL
jgi:hypothetical protein